MAVRHCVLVVALLTSLSWTALAQSLEGQNAERKRAQSSYEGLTRVIKSTIAPDTWDEVGGDGSFEIVDAWGLAVVGQTPEAHEKIESLLSTLRRVRLIQDGLPADAVKFPKSAIAERGDAYVRRNKVENALDEETPLDFFDNTLSDVADVLEEISGIPIKFDRVAMDEIGLTDDAMINFRLSGVSLRSALKLMLRQVGMTYVYDNEVLLLTTPEAAQAKVVIRVYPVRDLVDPPGHVFGRRSPSAGGKGGAF